MLRYVMPIPLTILVDVLAWGVFHAATGYIVHRLPTRRLTRDTWLLRRRRFETARWYQRRLKISRWKDHLPEAGAFFAGGVSKRHIDGGDPDALEIFVRETRRAEYGHWAAMACGPLFILWNPPLPAALLIGYGIAINLPFIAIQRYNRQRTQRLIALRSR